MNELWYFFLYLFLKQSSIEIILIFINSKKPVYETVLC